MSISQIDSTQSAMPEVVSKGANTEMNKEAFLQLLTIQLANQDPLNPMDSSGMAEQQAVFAQVEQLMNMNKTMESFVQSQEDVMLGIASVFNTLESASFLGQDVSYYTDDVVVSEDGSKTPLYFDLKQDALIGYTVTDANGSVVKTVPQTAMSPGTKIAVAWDGTNADGNPVPEGSYSVTMQAQDSLGNVMSGQTYGERLVKALDFRAGTPMLTLEDGTTLDVTKILSLAYHEG